MLLPPRARAYCTSQRIASEVARSGRTSTGTWYVAPPTRRDFTSMRGRTLSSARRNIARGSLRVLLSMIAKALYTICSAVLFLPPRMITLVK